MARARGLALAGLVLLLAATAASAGLATLRQQVSVTPAALSPLPATLAAGSGGTTTLGTPASQATTVNANLPALGLCCVETLRILRGDDPLLVHLVASAGTGSAVADVVTVQLVRGGTATTQVVLTGTDLLSGSGDQVSGADVALDDEDVAGNDLSIRAFGGCVGSCSLTMQLVFTIPGEPAPAFSYPYSLTVV